MCDLCAFVSPASAKSTTFGSWNTYILLRKVLQTQYKVEGKERGGVCKIG